MGQPRGIRHERAAAGGVQGQHGGAHPGRRVSSSTSITHRCGGACGAATRPRSERLASFGRKAADLSELPATLTYLLGAGITGCRAPTWLVRPSPATRGRRGLQGRDIEPPPPSLPGCEFRFFLLLGTLGTCASVFVWARVWVPMSACCRRHGCCVARMVPLAKGQYPLLWPYRQRVGTFPTVVMRTAHLAREVESAAAAARLLGVEQ